VSRDPDVKPLEFQVWISSWHLTWFGSLGSTGPHPHRADLRSALWAPTRLVGPVCDSRQTRPQRWL